MNKLNALDWIALVILIIGGINWGLVGLFNFDILAAIFGVMGTITRILYVVVGIAAIYVAIISARLAKA